MNRTSTNRTTALYYRSTDNIDFNPLTRTEEIALVEAFYAGSLEARDKLIMCHLKLAARIAISMAPQLPTRTVSEIISAANVGLVQALEVRRYDPARGARFSTYARHYIRGAILADMRKQNHVVPGRVDMPEDDLCRLADTIPATEPDPSEVAGDSQLMELAEQMMEKVLTPLERSLVKKYFFGGESLASQARARGASSQATQAAFNRALVKLKRAMWEAKAKGCAL